MSESTISRPEPISPLPEFADILRDDQQYGILTDERADNHESLDEQINRRFDELLLQSGLEVAPAVMLLLCLLGGVALGGLLFVLQEHLLTTALGTAVGAAIPVLAAAVARYRRKTKLLRQMPDMVDELARAARTGRSIEQCLQLVAEDIPSPLGRELQRCAQKLQMGVGLEEALSDLPRRTGLVSMNLFVTALTIHRRTGGDLVRVLERLAHTVRDRIAFLGRLRSATAASRATALLMLVLPPGILTFFVLRDPTYVTDLLATPWGRGATFLAVTLQIIGAIWILRIFKKSQRI